jgi:hypothetical protein
LFNLFKEHFYYLILIDFILFLILILFLINDFSIDFDFKTFLLTSTNINFEKFFYISIGLFILYLFQSASPLLLLMIVGVMALQSFVLRLAVGVLLLLIMSSALVLYCGRELLADGGAGNSFFIQVVTINCAVLMGGASLLADEQRFHQLLGSV